MVKTLSLGMVVATPTALEYMAAHNLEVDYLLYRHERGDWGNLQEEDIEANRHAVEKGGRVFSAYGAVANADGDERNTAGVWIITEADRSVTTVLRPEDY